MNSPAHIPAAEARRPGALLVPGWDDNHRDRYRLLQQALCAAGWICRLVDLPNAEWSPAQRARVTREDNLQDLLAAYDALAGSDEPLHSIGIVGVSYGAYLAALASRLRPVRWLALRAPALYRDEGWTRPKDELDKDDLANYRLLRLRPADNRALAACAEFRGDALLIGSGSDDMIPRPVIENYAAAFTQARSLDVQMIDGADHALSHRDWQEAFRRRLLDWLGRRRAEWREPSAASPDPLPRRKLRILVVEDEPDALAATLRRVQELGHWATGVQSAEGAKSRFLEGAFDVLMTDIGLPALSGRELAQALQQRCGFPVIFATGLAPPLQPAPGTFWLRKPYTLAQLDEALRAAAKIVPPRRADAP
ncbi:response regulator [Variovorax soli]|uniref:CheY-like chemotaxis protein/dienelactone hydrolase n=1 Tax=Variovorax soli TaxID=376815 RepID=A0ABU1NAE5_9BURK|nr:response regulator [Variovorax soli]MDR6535267.1 CheY-like chemotaxis protein/dienelactone hydrolase [Variovorax soli]